MRFQLSFVVPAVVLVSACSATPPRKPSSSDAAPAYPLNENLEAALPNESQLVGQIREGILALQEKEHAAHGKYLRGTHAKGTCVGGSMEIFDVSQSAPEVAGRVRKGIFSQPGKYETDVRFANADGAINHDFKKDVRAVSFSIQAPQSLTNDSGRIDFAMNNATTFPINDAQVFADVLGLAINGPVQSTKDAGLWREHNALGAVIDGKVIQEQPGATAYQLQRYWSTVPFSLGDDEAVKYSLKPCASNNSEALNFKDFDELRNELVRSVNEDPQQACFDFQVQLLDAAHMTHGLIPRHEKPSWWVENAATEWSEAQAPFHTVGRLTLVAKSVVDADTCERRWIDVIAHSSAAQHGLGSINRARAAAERASAAKRLQ